MHPRVASTLTCGWLHSLNLAMRSMLYLQFPSLACRGTATLLSPKSWCCLQPYPISEQNCSSYSCLAQTFLSKIPLVPFGTMLLAPLGTTVVHHNPVRVKQNPIKHIQAFRMLTTPLCLFLEDSYLARPPVKVLKLSQAYPSQKEPSSPQMVSIPLIH